MMSVPLSRPTLRRRDLNGVLSCLVSDRIGPGELNAELAGSLARQLGTAGGLCLSSYSAAIDRVLDLLELQAGDHLAMSALAPGLYREVCRRRAVQPLLVDVEERSPLPDAAAVERLLSKGVRPKAILLHYTFGYVPEADELLRLGIAVVEDVTHSLGGIWNGAPCGAHGQFAILSLQPEGIITTGQGAAVFARDRKTARSLAAAVGRYDRDQALADMNAALGLAQLRELERFLRMRREVASAYLQAVARSPHGALLAGAQSAETDPSPSALSQPAASEAVPYAFAVALRGGLKEARQYAAKRGVETRRAFADAVLALSEAEGAGADPLEADAPNAGEAPERFPRAYQLLLRSLQFPLYPALVKRDVQLVTKVLASLP
ncbi:MAG: DegT/DnrJ/EryC1/StrS aminotransferase family protein [Spirochaetales bacterium]|nr:DegT/DnrJ/EryC1/StrS aminotransferase family protein [Spirochaetales bacterium]